MVFQLHTLKNEELSDWTEVTKSQLQRGRIFLVLREALSKMVEVVGVKRPQVLTTQVVETDKFENFLSRIMGYSRAFTTVLDSFPHKAEGSLRLSRDIERR